MPSELTQFRPQVTQTISTDLTTQALLLSIDQVIKFADSYRDGIIECKNSHLDDRNKMPLFTQSMISIVNNCLQFVDLARKLKTQYPDSTSPFVDAKIDLLVKKFIELRNESADYLLEEAFSDLDRYFDELFTPKWAAAGETATSVDVICVTFEDYFQDYHHLYKQNYKFIASKVENLVAVRYLTAMLQKKGSFKTFEESKSAGTKIVKEIVAFQLTFSRIDPDSTHPSPFEIISSLAEVLIQDPEMLSLDLHKIVKTYPGITEDHLRRLCYLRGDIPQSELREKISHALQNNDKSTRQVPDDCILKRVVFVDRIINW